MQNYISKLKIADLGISSLGSWDVWLFVLLAAAAVVYSFLFVSRGRVVPVLVSTFLSYVLVKSAPFLDMVLAKSVGLDEIYKLNLTAFAVVFILLFLVLSRVILLSPVGSETFGIISSVVVAVIQMGLLAAVLGSFLPAEIAARFSPEVRQVFTGAESFFYWAAASVVSLLYVGFKSNRRI